MQAGYSNKRKGGDESAVSVLDFNPVVLLRAPEAILKHHRFGLMKSPCPSGPHVGKLAATPVLKQGVFLPDMEKNWAMDSNRRFLNPSRLVSN